MSPSTSHISRQKLASMQNRTVFPANIEFRFRFPLVSRQWTFSIDLRKFGESMVLLASLLYAAFLISDNEASIHSLMPNTSANYSISSELNLLCILSFLYVVWTHTTTSYTNIAATSSVNDSGPSPTVSGVPQRPSSPRLLEGRDFRRTAIQAIPTRADFGYIWMSVPKNYRDSRDDGIFTGLLLGPLIVSALLLVSLRQGHAGPSPSILPTGWLIEPPLTLPNARVNVMESIVLARYSLVNLSTFCSTILLFHVCASWWVEGRCCKHSTAPDSERKSVPRSEGRRSWYYILFTLVVSIGSIVFKIFLDQMDYGIWKYLNYFEVTIAAFFYQFALYMALRLAHRGFTLGELGLVAFGGTAICLEFLNITIARIWPVTTSFIRTYRLPTPLLIFQIALIVGTFLTGFLLSPFLVLSRNISRRPVHRLRFPEEKERNRRYYALGFYSGTVLIVGSLIGIWTRWCLGNRDPWLWVIFRLVEGKKVWSRPVLLIYWALLCLLSVAGWNRQLARSRRYRPRNAANENVVVPGISNPMPSPVVPASSAPPPLIDSPILPQLPISPGPSGMTFPNLPTLPALPTLPSGADVSNAATEFLDAADKHVPTLSLNARRKFFHALAVVMFIPGIAVDPAFTHLSFSVAFSLFTFAEYVRYFAIYPFGASVHLFMNEFLDHKDSGTAILSHFYLLTGCAGSVWLESPSRLLQFTGVICLGVGDAAASIVGRRIGKHRWSPSTSKTLEGSLAFAVSVVACAWILRLGGVAEKFSSTRYITVATISSLLEALSDQNDNLTLPLFMWSMLALADV